MMKLEVRDYSKNYGGVDVMIDGQECSVCSVAGYALYCKADPVAAVQLAERRGHDLVWINRAASVICGDAGFYERQAARRAAMPKLGVGDMVEFEGNQYQIVKAPNDNYALKRA